MTSTPNRRQRAGATPNASETLRGSRSAVTRRATVWRMGAPRGAGSRHAGGISGWIGTRVA
jgi:hypothetical protein